MRLTAWSTDFEGERRFVIGRNSQGELQPSYLYGDSEFGVQGALCNGLEYSTPPPDLANFIIELHLEEGASLAAPVEAGLMQTASVDFGPGVPLDVTGHEPANIDMANTTLETYEQDTECLECHRFASIAEKPDDSHKACNDKDAKCASDLSFIFDEANWPPTGAK